LCLNGGQDNHRIEGFGRLATEDIGRLATEDIGRLATEHSEDSEEANL
jgi:hypothetical protein